MPDGSAPTSPTETPACNVCEPESPTNRCEEVPPAWSATSSSEGSKMQSFRLWLCHGRRLPDVTASETGTFRGESVVIDRRKRFGVPRLTPWTHGMDVVSLHVFPFFLFRETQSVAP